MTDRNKRSKPAADEAEQPAGVSGDAPPERAAAAKEISMALRELRKRAEARNLRMVAYLLNLAELEALDCAGAAGDSGQASDSRCV